MSFAWCAGSTRLRLWLRSVSRADPLFKARNLNLTRRDRFGQLGFPGDHRLPLSNEVFVMLLFCGERQAQFMKLLCRLGFTLRGFFRCGLNLESLLLLRFTARMVCVQLFL